MKSFMRQLTLIFSLLFSISSFAQNSNINIKKWTVNGVEREAMIYVPSTAKSQSTPVIFVFHGHGETMQMMFDHHHFEQLWPEAIVIAPQGLNTPGQLVDRTGKKSGWQQAPGYEGDRDLHFFDTMLNALYQDYKIDKKRIFATGHSNGGSFTYQLWAVRGDVFAAVAPSAALIGKFKDMVKPKPVMHIMGLSDPLVRPMWQRMTCNNLLRINSCSARGRDVSSMETWYTSGNKTPVVVFAHPGGHVYPPESSKAVVQFFKTVTAGQ